MFDIGWTELLIIGVVALIVVGPKDLPMMFRQLGRFTGKLRQMAREFQRTMDQAADEAGVKDVARDLRKAASPSSLGLDAVKEAADRFEKWDPLKTVAKPAAPVTALGPRSPAPGASAPAAAAASDGTVPAATPAGPATQALREQAAERHRIAMEAAEKLRAVGRKPAAAPEDAAAPAPVKAAVTRKPRAAAAPPGDGPAPAAPKPRARKPKSET